MNLSLRFFLSILVGWVICPILWYLLLLISTALFVGTDLLEQYQELSRNSLVQRFILNPWEAMRIYIIILIANLGSVSLSSMFAGLIAREKGWVSGIIVAPFLIVFGLVGGSISKGQTIIPSITGLIVISFILGIGAFFGFLGEKIYKNVLKRKQV